MTWDAPSTRIVPRVMIAAPSSGSGKTTVVCGLLQALISRGASPAAFKCGPDFIDPLFHRSVLGTPGCNLDLFLSDEGTVRGLIARYSQGSDIALIEGVMGFYDGVSGKGTLASSYDVAHVTSTPVILVMDARGASVSLAATCRGFMTFRPDSRITGVILNRCSQKLCEMLAPMIEEECGVKVLGCLPGDDSFHFDSRHLGLVPADEVPDIRLRLERLGAAIARSINIDALAAIAHTAPAIEPFDSSAAPSSAPTATPSTVPSAAPSATPSTAPSAVTHDRGTRARIAVARDEAFCFYYQENLDLLAEHGADLAFFSPIRDSRLPEGSCALYLGGGYPELHARELSGNHDMLAAIREAHAAGMPIYAECGGFIYLHQTLRDIEGVPYPMAGVIRGEAHWTGHTQHFGYELLTADADTLICDRGTTLPAHEFHYYGSDADVGAFRASKPSSDRTWSCSVADGDLLGGFPHLYFPADPEVAERFVARAEAYRRRSAIATTPAEDGDAARSKRTLTVPSKGDRP